MHGRPSMLRGEGGHNHGSDTHRSPAVKGGKEEQGDATNSISEIQSFGLDGGGALYQRPLLIYPRVYVIHTRNMRTMLLLIIFLSIYFTF